MLNKSHGIGFLLTIVLAASWAQSATITFRDGLNGYTGTDDTYLQKNGGETLGTGLTIRDNGGRDFIEVLNYLTNSDSTNKRASLLRFSDLFGSGANQIPVGSTINSATLRLYVAASSSATLYIRQMAGAWTEGAADGVNPPPVDGVSVYAYRGYDSGGDHDFWGDDLAARNGPEQDIDIIRPIVGTLNERIEASVPSVGSALNVDVTNIVAAWLTGSLTNNGLILESSSSIYAAAFRSSEYAADSTLRPQLIIDYTPVPEPASVGLIAAGLACLLMRKR